MMRITTGLYPYYLTLTEFLKRSCTTEWKIILTNINICYSPAGRSIFFGRNCARGRRPRAVFQTEGTVSPNTDRPLIFFSYWDLKVSGKISFTLQPICVEVGRVCVDEARGRLQTKTKHYNMTFSSVIYFKALTALFWNKERFLCLARQLIIWVSNKNKRIDELDIKSPRVKNTARVIFGRIIQKLL